MPGDSRERRILWVAVLALYGASGCAGLVYEVVWSRWLGIHFGNTTGAHTVAISTFMGGLGLGYFCGTRVVSGLRFPLRGYGWIEIAIAFLGLFSLGLNRIVAQQPANTSVEIASLVHVLLPIALLLLPTVLMGMTFPFILAAASGLSRSGGTLPALYGVNGLGAALGSLASGFLLIPLIGLERTCLVGVSLNLVSGLGAVLLSLCHESKWREGLPPSPVHRPVGVTARQQGFLLIVVFGLGVASMATQSLWLRLLAMILGSSIFALSSVLAVFILGIGVGGILVSRSSVPAVKGVVGVAGFLSIWMILNGYCLDRMPFWFASLRLHCLGEGKAFTTFLILRFLAVFGLLFPVTLAFGMALPMATRGLRSWRSEVGGFALNTLGAVLGAGMTMPVFVPCFGIESTYKGVVLILLSISLAGMLHLSELRPRRRSIFGVSGVVLGGLIVGMGFDLHMMSSGAFRTPRLPENFETYQQQLRKSELVFYEDGPDASVAVLERADNRVLKVNGKPDASTRGDMFTQVLSGHLPFLIHPGPSSGLVVGLGSGVTAYGAKLHLDSLDVVEISGAVIRASESFRSVNHGVLEDPGVQMVQADARNFLRRTSTRYDVIVSEPSNPWMAGNAGLFSEEFFLLTKERLSEGGILAQWFHTYEMNEETLRLVFRTIASVFPEVTIWELFPNDLLLIASTQPLELDENAAALRVQSALVSRHLSEIGVISLPCILSRQAMSADWFGNRYRGKGKTNTDDMPILEYLAPRSLYEKGRTSVLREDTERRTVSGNSDLFLHRWTRTRPLQQSELEEMFRITTIYPLAQTAFRDHLVPQLVEASPLPFLTQLVHTFVREESREEHLELVRRVWGLGKEEPAALYALWLYFREKNVLSQLNLAGAGNELEWFLQRCVQLGDEPLQRCRQELDERDRKLESPRKRD